MIKLLDLKVFIIYALLYSLTMCVFRWFGKTNLTYWECFHPFIGLLAVLGSIFVLMLFWKN